MAKVGFISLGCAKATVDSERILTQLKSEGYEIVPDYDEAEVVVVNTCGFIESAVEESLEAIGEALDENGKVIVTGCLGTEKEKVAQVHPQVLAITGPQAYEEVMDEIHKVVPQPEYDPFVDLVPPQGVKLTPKHYAYLKISEGCDHKCSFCIIPKLRGPLHSRPIDEVLDEAEKLVDAGTRELLIISQDTSAYGKDLNHALKFWEGMPLKTHLQDLVKGLSTLGAWVRLHYVYPYPWVDDLIPLMAEGKLLPYLDIPFQHAHSEILKSMRRPGDKENILKRLEKWRAMVPDLTLRSTFIVGFPGETEDHFTYLLDFLKEAQLDRVGCFPYSAIEGALANNLPGAVPEAVKQERYERFMAVQSEISAQKLKQKIGRSFPVIIDGTNEEGYTYGRTQGDAPEVDGLVWLKFEENQQPTPGEVLSVKIHDADEHDLYGVVEA